MIKINEDNYQSYKSTFTVGWLFMSKILKQDPYAESSPLVVLHNLEQESAVKARKSLKIGLREIINLLNQVPPQATDLLEKILKEKDCPSIRVIIALDKSIPEKVIGRGKIKNMEEYAVVREVLNDVDYDISESERETLSAIFGEFENNI
ncbi:MAG: hypothetical protein AAF502_06555 [Bacteroidota bacterium]